MFIKKSYHFYSKISLFNKQSIPLQNKTTFAPIGLEDFTKKSITLSDIQNFDDYYKPFTKIQLKSENRQKYILKSQYHVNIRNLLQRKLGLNYFQINRFLNYRNNLTQEEFNYIVEKLGQTNQKHLLDKSKFQDLLKTKEKEQLGLAQQQQKLPLESQQQLVKDIQVGEQFYLSLKNKKQAEKDLQFKQQLSELSVESKQSMRRVTRLLKKNQITIEKGIQLIKDIENDITIDESTKQKQLQIIQLIKEQIEQQPIEKIYELISSHNISNQSILIKFKLMIRTYLKNIVNTKSCYSQQKSQEINQYIKYLKEKQINTLDIEMLHLELILKYDLLLTC